MTIHPQGAAILREQYGDIWACEPSYFASLSHRAADGLPDAQPRAVARRVPGKRGKGSTMVIPVRGLLTQRANDWGTSTDWLIGQVAAAALDSRIGRVILDIDSPGGVVANTPETFTAIEMPSSIEYRNLLRMIWQPWV